MPKYFFWKIALLIWLTLVIVAGLLMPMVPVPHAWYELPIIPALEDKARIIFFHVPMSWTTLVAFIASMVYGILFLKTKKMDYDLRSVSAAGLGTMFCVLATVTGSIWAKFNWGSFWNWDPRETSIFVLLLIYGAYFTLRSAIDVDEKKATLSAVYSVIAGVTAPFFIFVMPRIMTGLHPGAKGDEAGSTPVAQLHMPANMQVVFFASIVGFTLLYFWFFNLKVRSARLEQSIHQP
ncbi:MAG TPA: cytochrome c biogenesis protein CcsA [Bacteroidota bacterium]|nr:cytochrome c biogenesis protein CcsA [Bacteroidota bacterium]